MKKILFFIILSLLITPLFASSGDTLNIGGVVPLILTLVVTPDASADNLTLIAGSTTAVTPTIATIDITTNNTAGWELWVTSSNSDGGVTALINDDLDEIPYTLTYSGSTGASTTVIAAGTGTEMGSSLPGTLYSELGETLTINYNQEPDYYTGYYTDQLTIVLRAK